MSKGPIYFPYLRGKESELLALRDVALKLAKHGGVLPLIEPVRLKPADLLRAGRGCGAAGLRFAVAVNPRVGELAGRIAAVQSEIVDPLIAEEIDLIPAFQLFDGAALRELTTFLRRNSDRDVVIVHWDATLQSSQVLPLAQQHEHKVWHVFIAARLPSSYIAAFAGQFRAILTDGFQAKEKNADYSAESFFSDSWHDHREKKYGGFGDFLIVGDTYKDRGGPAHAVAIHLTHDQTNPPSIYCRHFVSTDTVGHANPGGKYLQAVAKLIKHVDRNPSVWKYSTAVPEFRRHHAEGHYPNLGPVKRLSMRHHLELMMHLL